MDHSPIPDFHQGAEQPLSASTLQLDWDAYFDSFRAVHGEPVRYGGKLLFADGWTYNGRDKSGPEWPPPSDPIQLCRMQRDYWKLRLALVKAEHDYRADELRGLRALQRTKTQPLMQMALVRDDAGQVRRVTQPVDVAAIESRLEWLTEDVQNCQAQIAHYQTQLTHLDRVRNLPNVPCH